MSLSSCTIVEWIFRSIYILVCDGVLNSKSRRWGNGVSLRYRVELQSLRICTKMYPNGLHHAIIGNLGNLGTGSPCNRCRLQERLLPPVDETIPRRVKAAPVPRDWAPLGNKRWSMALASSISIIIYDSHTRVAADTRCSPDMMNQCSEGRIYASLALLRRLMRGRMTRPAARRRV